MLHVSTLQSTPLLPSSVIDWPVPHGDITPLVKVQDWKSTMAMICDAIEEDEDASLELLNENAIVSLLPVFTYK